MGPPLLGEQRFPPCPLHAQVSYEPSAPVFQKLRFATLRYAVLRAFGSSVSEATLRYAVLRAFGSSGAEATLRYAELRAFGYRGLQATLRYAELRAFG